MSTRKETTQQGLPDWISPDLIAETIAVWQPSYPKRLTDRDAIEILLEVSALLDVLGEEDDETLRCLGKSL